MSVSQNRLRNHLPFILFFILFVVVGISTYKDYGISWDEPISRYNNGILNINFINTGDYEPIITGAEKYHGPIFEIFLVGLERMFELTDSQDIYFMRSGSALHPHPFENYPVSLGWWEASTG